MNAIQNTLVSKGAQLYKDLDNMRISAKEFKTEMHLLFDQSGVADFSIFDMLCYDRSF